MPGNIQKGNQPERAPSKAKARSHGVGIEAKLNFIIRTLRVLHENAFGPHETVAYFDNDENKALVADAADKSADPA